MQRRGFTVGYSDLVTIDTPFLVLSSYIYVPTGGTGDIVWLNASGNPQFLSAAGVGYHPLAASQIVTSATVNGTLRTTSASNMTYGSGG